MQTGPNNPMDKLQKLIYTALEFMEGTMSKIMRQQIFDRQPTTKHHPARRHPVQHGMTKLYCTERVANSLT
jgi:hypothetical protein